MPVLVCIFTAQILQDGRLTNIETQQTQSTPSVAADAGMDREALTTQLASNQRLVGASDPYDCAHQGELERHGGRQLAHVAMHALAIIGAFDAPQSQSLEIEIALHMAKYHFGPG